jgi:hypothetical protein
MLAPTMTVDESSLPLGGAVVHALVGLEETP